MTTVTQEQYDKRWDTLPDILREALTSPTNGDFVWATAENEHIPDEKISLIARTAALVLSGFIHAEDFPQEIKDVLGIDLKIAQSIADPIYKRIFAPLKGEIDKTYQPPGGNSLAPKMMQDIGAPASMPPRPMSIPTPPPAPKPATPGASKLPDVGWSRIAPSGPTLQFNASQIAPPPQAPKPMNVPPPIAPKPIAGMGNTMSEFERLGLSKNAPASPAPAAPSMSAVPKPPAPPTPPMPAAQPKAPEPAPVMLHEDTSFKASQKNADFHLSRPGEGAEIKMDPGKGSAPVKPAVLELGKTPAPGTPSTASQQHMVHYTELQAASMRAPAAPTGERHVTEITENTVVPPPKPPEPPKPPTPPMPPIPQPSAPPKPPQDKPVITKNYP